MTPDCAKLNFENLGPLKKGTLELKNFNLICGLSNSGKTYLAYLLFGVLIQRWKAPGDMFIDWESEDRNEKWRESRLVRISEEDVIGLFREFIDDINLHIDLYLTKYDEIDDDGEVYSEEESFIANIFNCNSKLFQDFSYELIPNTQTLMDGEEVDVLLINLLKNDSYIPKIPGLEMKWLDNKFVINAAEGTLNSDKELRDINFTKLFFSYFHHVFCGIWPRPYLFSTERISISLFRNELDNNRNLLVDTLQRQSDKKNSEKDLLQLLRENSSRFSKPIASNIQRIRNISEKIVNGREGILWRKNREELQRKIEKLNDGFTYILDENSQQFQYISIKDKISIPLHIASSMARELFDLYYYLRLDAAPGDIMIIDEPEAHLHPQKQMELTRLLAFLSNQGIRILITTHSDFIVREVNNLILANELESKEFYPDEKEWLNKSDISCFETVREEKDQRAFVLKKREVYPHGMAIDYIDEAIEEQVSTAAQLYDDLQEKSETC